MPANSQAQAHFFSLVRAHQEGKIKNPSKHVKAVAKQISKKDAHDFAATPTKGLPAKVEKQAAFKSAFIKQAMEYGFDENEANSILSSALH